MTDRPGVNSIPVLNAKILDGLVRLHANEMSRGLAPNPLLARSFIIKSNKYLRTKLSEAEMDREKFREIMLMIRSLVPAVFIEDSKVDIDELVEWLDAQGIEGYGFIYHRGINHFIFASWEDAALCRLRWT